MQVLPLSTSIIPIQVNFTPAVYPDGGNVQLQSATPDLPPVSGTLNVSSTVLSDLFETSIPAPVNFTIVPTSVMPTWLTIDKTLGTTPVEITFTANPSGLTPGTRTATFKFVRQRQQPTQPGLPTITVSFFIGQTPPPKVFATPIEVLIGLSESNPSGTAVIHLENRSGPADFTIDSISGGPFDGLKITPLAGTTPADITITAAPPTLENGASYRNIPIKSAGRVVGSFGVNVYTMLPGYLGDLIISPLSSTISPSTGRPNSDVPVGALFLAKLGPLIPPPPDSVDTSPVSLPFSLAGYSFRMGDALVPIRSYGSSTFLLQAPVDATLGEHTLDAFNSNGIKMATGNLTLSRVRPQMTQLPQDISNSTINASNPTRPGERVLVKLTGQGTVRPSIPSGQAAPIDIPSKPVLPVSAFVGSKPIKIVSALMSTSEAGILEVWLEIPNLYAGDHLLSISIGPLSAGYVFLKEEIRSPLLLILGSALVLLGIYICCSEH